MNYFNKDIKNYSLYFKPFQILFCKLQLLKNKIKFNHNLLLTNLINPKKINQTFCYLVICILLIFLSILYYHKVIYKCF